MCLMSLIPCRYSMRAALTSGRSHTITQPVSNGICKTRLKISRQIRCQNNCTPFQKILAQKHGKKIQKASFSILKLMEI